MNDATEVLAGMEFFSGLEENFMKAISVRSELQEFARGTYILEQGENANAFYVIESGEVSIEVGAHEAEQVEVQRLGAGEVLGFSWIFPPYRWRFSARANSQVAAVRVDAVDLRMDSTLEPALGFDLMRRFASVMAVRLQATRLELIGRLGP